MKAHLFNTRTSSTKSLLAPQPHSTLLAKLEQLHYEQGEKRLMLAVLKDAVSCIEHYHPHYSHGVHGGHNWLACRAAIGWVLSHDRTWLFSFENICAILELDPSRLRTALCTPLLSCLTKSPASTSLPKV